MGISTRVKVHQCRENEAHAYSAATPILRSVLIYRVPYSAAAILQTAKAKGRCMKSLPCFQCCSQEISHWTFVFYMCCGCDWLTQIVVEKSFFFSKIYLVVGLDRHSFFSVFLPHFIFLILEFLKKIGHTGIANTKKWLDQAVFPCWSNYHTLAGE